jgi:hypothetical protein
MLGPHVAKRWSVLAWAAAEVAPAAMVIAARSAATLTARVGLVAIIGFSTFFVEASTVDVQLLS